jgi:hypothetical protein
MLLGVGSLLAIPMKLKLLISRNMCHLKSISIGVWKVLFNWMRNSNIIIVVKTKLTLEWRFRARYCTLLLKANNIWQSDWLPLISRSDWLVKCENSNGVFVYSIAQISCLWVGYGNTKSTLDLYDKCNKYWYQPNLFKMLVYYTNGVEGTTWKAVILVKSRSTHIPYLNLCYSCLLYPT